jgi:uncharacterized protein (TIGR02466 family)
MEDFEIAPLFSTPFYSSKIDIDDNIKNIVQNLKYKRLDIGNGYRSENIYLLNDVLLESLNNKVVEQINKFVIEGLNVKNTIDFQITTSWAVRHDYKDWSQTHSHNNSLISGIVYIDTTPTSGKVIFTNNNVNLFPQSLDVEFEKTNLFNAKSIEFIPEIGTILMFPSFLKHQVTPNLSFENRYCIAFNVFPRGKLGTLDSEGLSNLDL